MTAEEMKARCVALVHYPSDQLLNDTGVLVFDARTVPSVAEDVARAILAIAANAIAAIPVESDPRNAQILSLAAENRALRKAMKVAADFIGAIEIQT